MATSITLIRHAEKPDDAGKEFGVDEHGKPDPRGLSARGWQRAGALVRWVVPAGSGLTPPAPVPCPQAIFAVAPSPSSRRPLLTVQPLASFIGVEIDAAFASDQVDELLQQVHAVPGAVLICWRHQDMPEIAKRLCPDLVPAPQWPQHCFDQAWLFAPAGDTWTMRQLAQQLLPGDSGQSHA